MSKEIVIEAGRAERQYWQDLWGYRELFYFLSWRDILVRYKQTYIGIAWGLIRPLLQMLVLTFIFRYVAKLDSPGEAPYLVLVMSALLPWNFFATTLTSCSSSLVANRNLVSKIYFPRLIVPVSTMIVNLVDLSVSASILIALMLWFDYFPTWRIVTLPLFLLLAILAALGLGLWMATLNVEYRDFRYIVPFITQLGTYISPVGFSSTEIPENLRFAYSLNPMVGAIDGFRWAILRDDIQLYWPGVILSALLVLLLFFSGIWFFRRMERTFADVI
ncbi:ABC transporter permease [Synechococcus sp. PCC 7336]|uniref:ABC transporter permease n=1 Tax=Synechococcus sp. PCC 7336 TaxID=195250 RepID=UPI00037EB3E7|nr:ABC transporter permease [Synechococcus sp. PCC 7336]